MHNRDHDNKPHNHQLTDSTLQNMALQGIPPSQLSSHKNYLALYLNREIGDEALWLDNLHMDRSALFQAEYDLVAGKHTNPYYDYPNAPVQPQFLFRNYGPSNPYGYTLTNNGIYSKEAPFTTDQGTTTLLRAQNNINTTGSIIQGALWIDFAPQVVCDSIFSAKKGSESYSSNVEYTPIGELSVYPNPVNSGDQLTIVGIVEGYFKLELINASGETVTSINRHHLSESQRIILHLGDLSSGLYFLKIEQTNFVQCVKIIVQ
jgi:hypothetical protein